MFELPGDVQIISIINKKSAQDLRLSKGRPVFAVIETPNIIIATDCYSSFPILIDTLFNS